MKAEAGIEFCPLTFKKLILVDPLTREKRNSLDEGFFSWGKIFEKEKRVILHGKKSVWYLQKKKKRMKKSSEGIKLTQLPLSHSS